MNEWQIKKLLWDFTCKRTKCFLKKKYNRSLCRNRQSFRGFGCLWNCVLQGNLFITHFYLVEIRHFRLPSSRDRDRWVARVPNSVIHLTCQYGPHSTCKRDMFWGAGIKIWQADDEFTQTFVWLEVCVSEIPPWGWTAVRGDQIH